MRRQRVITRLQNRVQKLRNSPLQHLCLQSSSRVILITAKKFPVACKVAKLKFSHNIESEIDIKFKWINVGYILHSTNACIIILHDTGDEMRKNKLRKSLCWSVKFHWELSRTWGRVNKLTCVRSNLHIRQWNDLCGKYVFGFARTRKCYCKRNFLTLSIVFSRIEWRRSIQKLTQCVLHVLGN